MAQQAPSNEAPSTAPRFTVPVASQPYYRAQRRAIEQALAAAVESVMLTQPADPIAGLAAHFARSQPTVPTTESAGASSGAPRDLDQVRIATLEAREAELLSRILTLESQLSHAAATKPPTQGVEAAQAGEPASSPPVPPAQAVDPAAASVAAPARSKGGGKYGALGAPSKLTKSKTQLAETTPTAEEPTFAALDRQASRSRPKTLPAIELEKLDGTLEERERQEAAPRSAREATRSWY